MNIFMKVVVRNVLLLTVCLLSTEGVLHAQSEEERSTDIKQEISHVVAELGDIIPLASNLSYKLRVLEKNISDFGDTAAVQDEYAIIDARLEEITGKFEQLKVLKETKYNKIVSLREKVKQKNKRYDNISKPLSKVIRQLAFWKKEWLVEKEHWRQFEVSLLTDEKLDQLKTTFRTPYLEFSPKTFVSYNNSTKTASCAIT